MTDTPAPRFSTFQALRDWWHGRDQVEDGGLTDADADDPVDADDPIDECPAGGEHDWEEIRAATAREPLFTVCQKCRERR